MSNFETKPQVPKEKKIIKLEDEIFQVPGRYRDALPIDLGGNFQEIQAGEESYLAFTNARQENVVFPLPFTTGTPFVFVQSIDTSGTPAFVSIFQPSVTATDFDAIIYHRDGGSAPAGSFWWVAFVL